MVRLAAAVLPAESAAGHSGAVLAEAFAVAEAAGSCPVIRSILESELLNWDVGQLVDPETLTLCVLQVRALPLL